MIIIAFFFLLPPGEYTDNNRDPFHLTDTQLFIVVSAAAPSPSTHVLGLVAAALSTKVKNKGLKTCV
jgi:hypothetical protein